MKQAAVDITLKATCICPHCVEYINLSDNFIERRIDVFKLAREREVTTAVCPECREKFEVKLNN